MNDNYKDAGTLVSVKNVTEAEGFGKGKDVSRRMFRFDAEGIEALIAALTPLRGKMANLDFRIQDKEYEGRQYRGAYALVKESIPLAQRASRGGAGVAKSDAKARAEQVRNQFNKGN